MKISKPEIIQQKNEAAYRVDVESSDGVQTLWYSLQSEYGDFLTTSCDAPLLALLIPAMANGEDIHVAGAISETLWYNLSRPYQLLLQYVLPWLQRVNIYPEELQTTAQRAPGVATGFSGGIDSYCVLADHYYQDVPKTFKVTHLLFNNVGSHARGGERLFAERYARLEPLTKQLKLPFLKINSNLDEFYGERLPFIQTATTRNMSVALLLQGGIGRFMHASAYCYADLFLGKILHMGYIESIAVPLLSTEALDAISAGSEYTRVEKTLRVADIEDSYSTLDVCLIDNYTGPPTNCSECSKCKRTLLTMDIAGVIDRYANAFDLDLYKQYRTQFIRQVLISDDPLLIEIVQFASELGYSLDPGPRNRRGGRLKRALRLLRNVH